MVHIKVNTRVTQEVLNTPQVNQKKLIVNRIQHYMCQIAL
jgi:hypothetical protein